MNTKCSVCRKTLCSVYTLKTHLRKFHPDEAVKLAPPKTYNFQCQDCGRNFSHLRHLKYHRKKVHAEGAVNSLPSKKKCPMCNYYGAKAQELNDHFANVHNITVNTSTYNFLTTVEFTVWKEGIEKQTNAHYVKASGATTLSNAQQRITYVCHRSGKFTSKSKGLRLLKSQGSNKINGFCPASMKVITAANGSCKVTFCETHVGHENDLNHLFLKPSEKEKIAAKIAKDISFGDILREVRDSQDNLNSERICLLRRKDLHNIKQRLQKFSTSTRSETKEFKDINCEDDDLDSDLIIESDNTIWIKSGEDHDYLRSMKIDSLSEEKMELKTSMIEIISSISCIEEVEAMKKIIDSIKPSLAEVKRKAEVKIEGTSSVKALKANGGNKKIDDKLQRRLIIVKGTKQVVIHNPQQIK